MDVGISAGDLFYKGQFWVCRTLLTGCVSGLIARPPALTVRRQLPTGMDVVNQSVLESWEGRGWPSSGMAGGGSRAVKYGETGAV